MVVLVHCQYRYFSQNKRLIYVHNSHISAFIQKNVFSVSCCSDSLRFLYTGVNLKLRYKFCLKNKYYHPVFHIFLLKILNVSCVWLIHYVSVFSALPCQNILPDFTDASSSRLGAGPRHVRCDQQSAAVPDPGQRIIRCYRLC